MGSNNGRELPYSKHSKHSKHSLEPRDGSGTTDISINRAAMFGLTIQKSRWYGDFSFEYAGLHGSHSNPRVHLNVNGQFAGGLVGYDV